MVDTGDLKSPGGNPVQVRLLFRACLFSTSHNRHLSVKNSERQFLSNLFVRTGEAWRRHQRVIASKSAFIRLRCVGRIWCLFTQRSSLLCLEFFSWLFYGSQLELMFLLREKLNTPSSYTVYHVVYL
jgi:hypothetical protein